MKQIILIAHNLRSCHNVGSLLRTAEGLGVSEVILTGYTPYPLMDEDGRLSHISARVSRQIHKTALGAESLVRWRHESEILTVIKTLQAGGVHIAALEQTPGSTPLPEFETPQSVALIVGREVEGIEAEVVEAADSVIEIPMSGRKESFNVVQAAAMALYHFRFNGSRSRSR
jgi:tRNA G18 (ribose-2'-O)-methylase SpoU